MTNRFGKIFMRNLRKEQPDVRHPIGGRDLEMKLFKQRNSAGLLLKILVLGTLCIGLGAPLAQCPAEGSTCANQVVPLNLNTEYQKAGEASRINGAGARKLNKIQKVLLYDLMPGTNHQQGKDGVRRMMVRMANRFGFELTINDGAVGWITAERLQGVNAVVLAQGDADVLGSSVTSASAIAMENYIYKQGGSLLMIHAASAFITCPGTGTNGGGQNIDDVACHFLARATVRQYYHHQSAGTQMKIYVDSTQAGEVPPHNSMGATGGVGPVPPAATIPHGRVNPETKNIFNNAIPFNWPLPPNSPTDARTNVWENWADEWYNYSSSARTINATMIRNVTNFSPAEKHIEGKVNVLLAIDETSRDIGDQRMGDHPMSWTRRMGKGLSAYASAGHDNAPFLGRSGGGRTGVDTLAGKYYWNLLRYLGRDYEGCMDSKYKDYNPYASVKNITGYEDITKTDVAAATPAVIEPCVTAAVGLDAKHGQTTFNGITVNSNSIMISAPENGVYRILITDLRGRAYVSQTLMGGSGIMFNSPNLPTGQYIVRVRSPKGNGFEITHVVL
jgi:hypothetical protein